jgi:hypothetical protein
MEGMAEVERLQADDLDVAMTGAEVTALGRALAEQREA